MGRPANIPAIINADKQTHSVIIEYGNLKGEFEFKLATLLDTVEIGVKKAKIAQGAQLDVLADNILHMTATLEKVLIKKPSWFDVDKMADYLLLDRVYEEYNLWVSSFRSSIGKNEEDSRDTTITEDLED